MYWENHLALKFKKGKKDYQVSPKQTSSEFK